MNNIDMIESIIIKLKAHKDYVVPRIHNTERRSQAKDSFDSIIDYIKLERKAIDPSKMRKYIFVIKDDKTHQDVLDTYEDIYYNMFKRFFGRSGDCYLEKL